MNLKEMIIFFSLTVWVKLVQLIQLTLCSINLVSPLEPNPSQPPLDRGGARFALPLLRGSWRGFEPHEQSGLKEMTP
jgi:hypothetical protein